MAQTNGSLAEASLTRLTAQRLHVIATTELSAEVRDKVSLAIVDYLGAVGSGLEAPWASSVIQYAKSRKGASEAHAWGLNEDVPAETAAFVNATFAHSAIRDDMHLKSNSHIGGIAISAALAFAQRDGWSYDQLVRGIVGGYEAAGLLGTAIQQSEGYNKHFRPSGLIGAFGAAATAIAATRRIDEEIAANALSFAANMASGFNQWAWTGGMEIYTEMGTASQAGVIAFDLALAGMKCSEVVLEGRAGCFAALGISGHGEKLYRQGLDSWDVGRGVMDIRFKPAPGCNYAQTPTATALKLAEKHQPKDIVGVKVGCTIGAKNYPGCDNPGPFETIQQTKMSIQFGVCTALVYGSVPEEAFQKFKDAEINRLAAVCTVDHMAGYDQDFQEGRQPARIEVRLGDGQMVIEQLADVPWLDADAVQNRFARETELMLPRDTASRILGMVRTGGIQSSAELTGLFKAS